MDNTLVVQIYETSTLKGGGGGVGEWIVKKGISYVLAIARDMLTLFSNKQHTPALHCIGNPVARLSGRTARLPCIPLGRGRSRSEIRKPNVKCLLRPKSIMTNSLSASLSLNKKFSSLIWGKMHGDKDKCEQNFWASSFVYKISGHAFKSWWIIPLLCKYTRRAH